MVSAWRIINFFAQRPFLKHNVLVKANAPVCHHDQLKCLEAKHSDHSQDGHNQHGSDRILHRLVHPINERQYYNVSCCLSLAGHIHNIISASSHIAKSHGTCIIVMLTPWGRDKMDAILQKAFSSAFSWMKMFEFQLRYHWSLFLKVQSTIFQHWFR